MALQVGNQAISKRVLFFLKKGSNILKCTLFSMKQAAVARQKERNKGELKFQCGISLKNILMLRDGL
jgi:hypothetical protein